MIEAMQAEAAAAIEERRKLEAREAGRRQVENMAYPALDAPIL